MENRKFSRVNFNSDTLISHRGMEFEGTIINLSLKGAYLKSRKEINAELYDPVEVKIKFNNTPETLILAKGIIVRIQNKFTAIKFEELDLDSFTHLRSIVSLNFGDYDKIMDELFYSMKEEGC